MLIRVGQGGTVRIAMSPMKRRPCRNSRGPWTANGGGAIVPADARFRGYMMSGADVAGQVEDDPRLPSSLCSAADIGQPCPTRFKSCALKRFPLVPVAASTRILVQLERRTGEENAGQSGLSSSATFCSITGNCVASDSWSQRPFAADHLQTKIAENC